MDGRRKIRVIRSWEDCKARIPRGPALVEVPGEWAYAVLSLIMISQEHRHNGLIVTNIGPDSQGARAGMARGDVLLRYDGVELDNAGTLTHLTERHAEGARVSKTMTIDAVRGSEDVNFQVNGGRLGITVSASLHRLRRVSVSRTKPQQPDGREAGARSPVAVIRTPEDAMRLDPGKPTLVEVPGELARKVLFLVKALELSGASKRKKMARALLSTARL